MIDAAKALAFVLGRLICHPIATIRTLWAIDYSELWAEVQYELEREERGGS